MEPSAQYRLKSKLTAIDHAEERPRVVRLAPGTVVTVAAVIPLSQFVQVTHEGRVYEVLKDDLAENASRRA
jgi:hypothetical protein